ncbi:MAG: hypothetical protein QXM43_07915 [Desulfurococcaceae archaeon]
MKIAVVRSLSPKAVRVISSKLILGLASDGFIVKPIDLRGGMLFSSFMDDFLKIYELNKYDIILYTGSIARISSIILRGKISGIFIHGFVLDEVKNTISYRDIRTGLSVLFLFTWWKTINMSLFKPNFYICHSKTSCKFNLIPESKCVILPQFVLPIEVEIFKKIRSTIIDSTIDSNNKYLKIVTYRSFAISPRLLSSSVFMYIVKRVASCVNKNVVFYIIDPAVRYENVQQFGRVKVIMKSFMRRADFLKLLALSDLYIERCIDEELGLGSIEAGLLRVPVAKITHPQFKMYQDYTEDEVLVESSVSRFADLLCEYLNNIEKYKDYYSNRYHDFILDKRSWDHVKKPLIEKLNYLKA